MAGYRMDRVNEDVLRVLTDILRTVKDPRVNESMISIVRVDVTNDLSYATVFISSLSGIDKAKEAVVGLKSAGGYIRRELGLRLKLRHVPELRFVADGSIEYSQYILDTLRNLDKEREDGRKNREE